MNLNETLTTRLATARETVVQHAVTTKAKNEAAIIQHPFLGLLGKLVRKLVGAALLLTGFIIAYQGLEPHDLWFVAGGVLLMLAGFFAVARNDTVAFGKFVASLVFGWRGKPTEPQP